MRNIFLSFLSFFLLSSICLGQIPQINWTKTLGGSNVELQGSFATVGLSFGRWAAIDTDNNNRIYIATTSRSNDFFVSSNSGEEDIWVICMNFNGDTLWTKVIGGSSYERVLKVRALSAGGCILVGYTISNNGFFSTNHSSMQDGFLIRLAPNGDIVWSKLYGGTDIDMLYDVIETSDGYLMACGESTSYNGDLAGVGDGFNWVLKVNKDNGNKVWSKTFLGPDGSSNDRLENMFRLTELNNNSIILTGYTTPDFNNFNIDRISIFKIDLNGNLTWTKKIGAPGSGDYPTAILKSGNSNFYILGKLYGTVGGGGDASNYYGGSGDFWLVKLDESGIILQEKNYGGSDLDVPYDMLVDAAGNLLLAGLTRSNNYDCSTNTLGGTDFWLLMVNSLGDTICTKRMGGSANDFASGIALSPTQDNIFLVGGTESSDGMVTGYMGQRDVWVVSLSNPTVDIIKPAIPAISLYPNPVSDKLNIFGIQPNEIKSVQILDATGKICMNISPSSNEIDISRLKNGVYTLQILSHSADIFLRAKFVKI